MGSIVVNAPRIVPVSVNIIGDSPLIQHAWSHKAKQQMLDKQMKKAAKGREAKDPEQDYRDSLYPGASDKTSPYGFPAVAFKAAMVGAARSLDLKMTTLRQVFHIETERVPIYGNPQPREDMVRLNGATADIRYRAEFTPWASRFTINLNEAATSVEQILNLLNHAGFSVGVGEWRPERDGPFGRFRVVVPSVVDAVIASMDPRLDPRA